MRGLTDTVGGMPTAALADEILLEGEGQVKALICIGGNPMAAWPDQRKTLRALESLDLLVTLDTEMSPTSRLADYVIAPMMQMETPAMTMGSELIKYYTSGTGIPAAYAQYTPRLVEPPAGSDLTEEWQFFHGLAKRMGLEMWFVNFFGGGGGKFMESPPIVITSTATASSPPRHCSPRCARPLASPSPRSPSHPHGKIFDVDEVVARTRCRLHRRSMSATPTCSASWPSSDRRFRTARTDAAFPFRLIPRTPRQFHEFLGHQPRRTEPRQALQPCLHASRAHRCAGPGFRRPVTVTSPHDSIPSVLEADDTLRRDVIAMHHAFGGLPSEDGEFRERGSNVGRLVPTDSTTTRISGLPRQGNIPVSISPVN